MNLIQDVLRAAESKPEQDRFVRVKLEDILPDPENFYNTDEIEELAAAIDAFGLEQPLVVRPADDEPGKYRLTVLPCSPCTPKTPTVGGKSMHG